MTTRGFYEPLTDLVAFAPGAAIEAAEVAAEDAPDEVAAPGPTRVEEQAEAMRSISPSDLTAIVADLRARERAAANPTANKPGFSDDERTAAIEDLASSGAKRLGVDKALLAGRIMESYRGLMGIGEYLDDPLVSDILINAFDEVWVERAGKMRMIESPFASPADTRDLMLRLAQRDPERMAVPTTTNPSVSWDFEYTTPTDKVNIRAQIELEVITNHHQVIISLRKPSNSALDSLDMWASADLADPPMTPEAVAFLREAVRRRATILVVGGTGSGKTTLLKSLLREIPKHLQIITIEHTQELVLRNRPGLRGLLALYGRTIADLVRDAMRLRPDVLVIGEIRDSEEAMGFINAVNTGHEGSITTIHASSARDGLYRILNLVADASGKASLEYVGERVRDSLDLVVFIGTIDGPPDEDGAPTKIRRVAEIAIVDTFTSQDNRGSFTISPLFGRYRDGGTTTSTAVLSLPLRALGPGNITARFRDKMFSRGMADAELDALVPYQALDGAAAKPR
jgi:Flp pilus assembly CpaF family ATPase